MAALSRIAQDLVALHQEGGNAPTPDEGPFQQDRRPALEGSLEIGLVVPRGENTPESSETRASSTRTLRRLVSRAAQESTRTRRVTSSPTQSPATQAMRDGGSCLNGDGAADHPPS